MSLAVDPSLLKNRGSSVAEHGCHKTLPPRAAACIRQYIFEGRAVLAAEAKEKDDMFFLLSDEGKSLTTCASTQQLARVALRYAPQYFPSGLSFHDLRHLVAADLVRRFGRELGGRMGSEALIINFSTVLKTYAHQALDAVRWTGQAVHEFALEDGFVAAEQKLRNHAKSA